MGTLRIFPKKLLLQLFLRIFFYSHENIIKCFDIILTYYWDQRKTTEKSVTFDVNSSKMNEQTKLGNREMIVYKKTDEWCIEWQRVVQRVTTNDNEWYKKNISLTTFLTVDDFFSLLSINTLSLISSTSRFSYLAFLKLLF